MFLQPLPFPAPSCCRRLSTKHSPLSCAWKCPPAAVLGVKLYVSLCSCAGLWDLLPGCHLRGCRGLGCLRVLCLNCDRQNCTSEPSPSPTVIRPAQPLIVSATHALMQWSTLKLDIAVHHGQIVALFLMAHLPCSAVLQFIFVSFCLLVWAGELPVAALLVSRKHMTRCAML